jgi:hypothetical protein
VDSNALLQAACTDWTSDADKYLLDAQENAATVLRARRDRLQDEKTKSSGKKFGIGKAVLVFLSC